MNYYEILEISSNASDEVIKMAYKALVKKYHPDVTAGNMPDIEKKIQIINEAYSILSDKNKRIDYDDFLNTQKANEINKQAMNNVQNPEADKNPYSSDDDSENSRRSFIGKIVDFLSEIYNFAITAIVIIVVVGLVTGHLDDWAKKIFSGSKELFYKITSTNDKQTQKYEDGSPEYVIEKYIQSLLATDESAFTYIYGNDYLNTYTSTLLDTMQSAYNEDTVKTFYDDITNLDYTIEGSGNSYKVTFLNYNYYNLMMEAASTIAENATTEQVIAAERKVLSKASRSVQYVVEFDMIQDDKSVWKINDYNSKTEFLCALTGDIAEKGLEEQGITLSSTEVRDFFGVYSGTWETDSATTSGLNIEVGLDPGTGAVDVENLEINFISNGVSYRTLDVKPEFINQEIEGNFSDSEISGKCTVTRGSTLDELIITVETQNTDESTTNQEYAFKEYVFKRK